MPSLVTHFDGLTLPNPFVIASGPPGTNASVISRAFDEGWGAVVCKTLCLDANKIVNVQPRYARLKSMASGETYGWENIELISDRPFDVWLNELRELKRRRPESVLIASVMDEYRQSAWDEIVTRVQETGVDALELNLSCPHGLPERKMGSAVGEDPQLVEEVCQWVSRSVSVPFWAKLTPNVTRVEPTAEAALRGGASGLSAINTLRCVLGVNLDTLKPEPTVGGYSTQGGYSGPAVRPIALRICFELAALLRDEYPNRSLHGIGGVETGFDAAQFLLAGCHSVQACTAVMKSGYGVVQAMQADLKSFMTQHGFETIDQFRGRALPFLTSHQQLVERQQQARGTAKNGTSRFAVEDDADWRGDDFVQQSETLSQG